MTLIVRMRWYILACRLRHAIAKYEKLRRELFD